MAANHKKSKIKLTRKQMRKEKRKEKKIKKDEFYRNRSKAKNGVSSTNLLAHTNLNKQKKEPVIKQSGKSTNKSVHTISSKHKTESVKQHEQSSAIDKVSSKVMTIEEIRNKEQKEKKKLLREMNKQRTKQLLDANADEDRNIKQLEKQLKLNKRKSKSIPKSFSEDGLDYLLEVCDSETMGLAVATEQDLNKVNNKFEEDFSLMTGGTKITKNEKVVENASSKNSLEQFSDDSDIELDETDNDSMNSKSDVDKINSDFESENEENNGKYVKLNKADFREIKPEKQGKGDANASFGVTIESNTISKNEKSQKRKKSSSNIAPTKKAKLSSICHSNSEDDALLDDQISESDMMEENEVKGATKKNSDGTWEDIYGRLRSKDGAIISNNDEKYVPPSVRAKLEKETNTSDDKMRMEKLDRLKKQLKGYLNRLAESNMHNISTQIENVYMHNSRNDMSETLTNLVMESLVSRIITPERLLIEHVVLVIILHANVGTEVGAHFLQNVIKKFGEYMYARQDVENKMMDNIINIVSQLYNFKLFDAKLIYEILYKLMHRFEEKDIECILHILKCVGFTLRKDDPITLKNFILDVQKHAASASEEVKDNPRVKFMLDILLAIKNNNVTKIPNYDTSYSEHLKKVMKAFIRKGNYVTQLNISLEDLLKAEERGKWWVVGSAWTGNAPHNNNKTDEATNTGSYSEKLLQLAKKQRMNTDTRRNIFCILMSAEDYLDAFEKLLHLGLKNQQEQEIVNIILQCCLQEKKYNPYYAVLAQKFCEYDRKYQMTIKCSIWDKLKSLGEHSVNQLSNLAKLLTYLFIEKGLPISTLKIVEFSDLDKITLRFMRQILLAILLHKDTEACIAVFEKVAQSEKLKMFRESLRLFIHHFLLRNLKSDGIPEEQRTLLEERAKMVEKLLISKENKIRF